MILGAKSYTVERYTVAEVDGVITPSLSDEFTVTLGVQPLSADELQNFPEGFRARAMFKAYGGSSLELFAAPIEGDEDEGAVGRDFVIYRNQRLAVHGDHDYRDAHALQHRKWILAKPETEVERTIDG